MKCIRCKKEIPKDDVVLYDDSMIDMGPGCPYHRKCLEEELEEKGKKLYNGRVVDIDYDPKDYCEICNCHKDVHHVVEKDGKKKLICENCGLCSEIHIK